MLNRKVAVFLLVGMAVFLPLFAGPLIPVEDLFVYRDWISVSISPDGQYVAGIKPVAKQEGKRRRYSMASFVIHIDSGKMELVSEMDGIRTERISDLWWSGDHRLIVRTPWGLRSVDTDGSNLVYLTGWEANHRTRVNEELGETTITHLWPLDPEHILLQQNAPGKLVAGLHIRYFDMEEPPGGLYRINVYTGETENICHIPFVFDRIILDTKGMPCMVIGNPDAEQYRWGSLKKNFHTKEGSVGWYLEKSLYSIDRDGALHGPLDIKTRPDTQYGYESVFQDVIPEEGGFPVTYLEHEENGRVAVWRKESIEAEPDVIYSHPVVDVDYLLEDRYSGKITAVAYNDGKPSYEFWDKEAKTIHSILDKLLPNRTNQVSSSDRNGIRHVIYSTSPQNPGEYYLLDLKKKTLNEILNTMPELHDYAFSPMEPVTIPTRDQSKIYGYLTLPRRQKEKTNLPAVLYIHGGPYLRDYWTFQRDVQFYADRGYAVLQPNYRGSDGYGLEYLRAGKKQWGLRMQEDVEDAVAWIVKEGIADPDRIIIAGVSYGGYATMMGLIKTPELFQAGIAGAGVYDLQGFAREPERYKELGESGYVKKWIGDPENEEDMARLWETSPMNFVEKIEDPVFLWHGGDDKRARVNHAFELAHRMRTLGKTFETYWEPLEGHGFRNKDKRAKLYENIEDFLREYAPSDILLDSQ